MPAVAAGANANAAAFYWHLGDFRAIYDFDQDILGERKVAGSPPPAISDYFKVAWDDFLQSQIAPFAARLAGRAVGYEMGVSARLGTSRPGSCPESQLSS